MRAWPVPVIAALVLAVGGCTAETAVPVPSDTASSPFADCAGLTAAPPSAAPADLPAVELPCFTGGQPVRLNELRGPAVLNVWASWCEPCRAELPLMQELADRTTGRLHVVGVNFFDSRDSAASFAADKKVSMPTLYDRDKLLAASIGQAALPVTVFVDADGRRTVYRRALTPDDIAERVRAGTGVTP